MSKAFTERTRPLKRCFNGDIVPAGMMSLHSVNLLLEATLLKGKSLEEFSQIKVKAVSPDNQDCLDLAATYRLIDEVWPFVVEFVIISLTGWGFSFYGGYMLFTGGKQEKKEEMKEMRISVKCCGQKQTEKQTDKNKEMATLSGSNNGKQKCKSDKCKTEGTEKYKPRPQWQHSPSNLIPRRL
ncbi:putative protein isoform X2 [Capsicum chacoense]